VKSTSSYKVKITGGDAAAEVEGKALTQLLTRSAGGLRSSHRSP